MIFKTDIVLASFDALDHMSRAEVVCRNNRIYVKKYVCKEMLSLEGPFKSIKEAEEIAEDFTSCSY